jgi:hypothetical protein
VKRDHDCARFGDPGSISDVAAELLVEARDIVDIARIFVAVQRALSAQMKGIERASSAVRVEMEHR